MKQLRKFFLPILMWAMALPLTAVELPKRQQVLERAKEILENWEVSYVYGGSRLGAPQQCSACNSCLAERQPGPKARLTACPVCSQCSLDCSHFVYEVFKQAGLSTTYLTTAMMNDLDAQNLVKRYKLVDIGSNTERAMPGDIIVYDGHVVLLERRHRDGKGDILHSTSGRHLKGAGMGLQRERHVVLEGFRGPILRILRHLDLAMELRNLYFKRQNAGQSPPKTSLKPIGESSRE